jgi:2-keto-4-pentenoate hydratase/2-oxohepta-3-ene-1,7-dioic acid hydratase in catechol pathway
MKIARFRSGQRVLLGELAADGRSARRIDGPLFDGSGRLPVVSGDVVPVDALLAPLVPVDILCIGLNYREHAAEGGFEVPVRPMLFIKASNTLTDPGRSVPLPALSQQVDYEGELVVVIGRAARDVPRERALDFVFGYTIANDITARDWQRDKALGGGQFARGKSFDGFCPLGPALVTTDEIPNPNALRIRTSLNGKLMQNASTAEMMFDVPTIIESLTSTMTLQAGTIILTGTPPGVGMGRTPPEYLKRGDVVAVEIDGLGRLENSFGG